MPKNTVHDGPSNLDDPELDPRPADFTSTGEGASDFEPEPEDAEIDTRPPAPEEDPNQTSLFQASGDLDVEPVPTGSIDEVQSWVGDDRDKAKRALEAERSGKKRSGLITYLEKVVAAK